MSACVDDITASMEAQTAQRRGPLSVEELSKLIERSDLRAGWHTFLYFGTLGLSTYLLVNAWGTWWALPLFMVQGTLLANLNCAQHEFAHFTAFNTKALNVVWGHITGLLVILPMEYQRLSHMLHHQYTGMRGRDQELDDYRSERKPFTIWTYLWWLFSLKYYPKNFMRVVGRIWGATLLRERRMLSPNDRKAVIAEGRWYAMAYVAVIVVSVHFETWAVVKFWILPMIIMKWTHQVHNLTEHYGLPKVTDILSNTRTMYTTPLGRWLVWCMAYHTAHHRYANVPFYNLKQLDRKLRPYTRYSTTGYLRFHWRVISCALRGKRFAYEGLM